MRNILITYLSTLPSKNKNIKYKSRLGTIEAPYTNEAGIKYLANYLKPDDRPLDMVIAVCSGDVKNKEAESFGNIKAIDYFKEILAESFPECDVRIVDTNGRTEGKNDVGKVFNALSDITADDRLFLDITGGFRDSAYTLSLIGRFLEFKNVCIEMVVYSLLNNNDRTSGKITNYTPDYRLIDLVNGMNEFVNFGSARTIKRFFDNSDDEDVRALVNAMQGFSDAVSLGKTGDIDTRVEELKRSIESVENGKAENIEYLIFRDMLPVIKNKLFADSAGVDYISLIEWCTGNRMIQQALTLYVEKVPEYLFGTKLIEAEKEKKDKAKKEKQPHDSIYTWMLYSDILLDKTVQEELRQIITDMNNSEPKERKRIKSELPKGSLLYNAAVSHLEIISAVNNRTRRNIVFSTTAAKNAWKTLKEGEKWHQIKNPGNDYINALLGAKPIEANVKKKNESFSKKLDIFKRMEKGAEITGYRFGAQRDRVLDIIRSYLYIKQVRNEVNHASDDENLTREQIAYFKQHGFEYKMTLDSLANDIETGIKAIREAEKERRM